MHWIAHHFTQTFNILWNAYANWHMQHFFGKLNYAFHARRTTGQNQASTH